LGHFHPHPEINSGQALNPLPSRERKQKEKGSPLKRERVYEKITFLSSSRRGFTLCNKRMILCKKK